jgi:DNA-directed RNA polymerase II subunit RPB1
MHSMYPTKGGINDARMGSTNRRWNCLTCQGSAIDCQGHFGHMQLAWPVYHLGFLPIVKKILDCVCFNCNQLLCPTDDPYVNKIRKIKNGSQRLQLIHKLCSSYKECITEENQSKEPTQKRQGCGYRQPKFFIQKLFIRYRESESN